MTLASPSAHASHVSAGPQLSTQPEVQEARVNDLLRAARQAEPMFDQDDHVRLLAEAHSYEETARLLSRIDERERLLEVARTLSAAALAREVPGAG